MKNILIEIIITNQCNKRCSYCDLTFSNNTISEENIILLQKFLKKNPANYTINFFGGEPLLFFDKLKKIYVLTKKYVKNFTIGTNGILLTEEKLNFFKRNNFLIHLSVDNVTKGRELNFELLKNYVNLIELNLIFDPEYINYTDSLVLLKKLQVIGFQSINIMPVYATKKWTKRDFVTLKSIVNFTNKITGININKYNYFNGVSSDIQYILDTDGCFYADIDSLLWLQKQYDVLGYHIKQQIEKTTKLGKISQDIILSQLINKYNYKKILDLIFQIPKELGYKEDYYIIKKIFEGK